MVLDQTNKHLVAVYGTLKRKYNLNPSLVNNGAEFVGESSLKGMMLSLNAFPALLIDCGTFDRDIPCEVYRVNDFCLARLDNIEGHPSFYERVQVDCSLGKVWVYIHHKKQYIGKVCRLVDKGGWEGASTPTRNITFKESDLNMQAVAKEETKVSILEEGVFPKVVNV